VVKKNYPMHLLCFELILYKIHICISFEIYSGTLVHEQIFQAKKSRMTNVVSDYEHASWLQWQAESIGAGVSVVG
jgi:hypothetical protein